MLANHGVNVKTKDRIHQKFAVINQRLIWYGSINLLSYGASEESIMRTRSFHKNPRKAKRSDKITIKNG